MSVVYVSKKVGIWIVVIEVKYNWGIGIISYEGCMWFFVEYV